MSIFRAFIGQEFDPNSVSRGDVDGVAPKARPSQQDVGQSERGFDQYTIALAELGANQIDSGLDFPKL